MNVHLEKIVSVTMRNNIKLLPLTFEYVKNFACGIGMPEKRGKILPD